MGWCSYAGARACLLLKKANTKLAFSLPRNHIPEKKGTWMEEWHQKLHNNTTPDDVPICQAYIAFLQVLGCAVQPRAALAS